MSDSETPWTVARQAPLSMEFFRQEYWSGLPFPPPGDLPHPMIEPGSPAMQETPSSFPSLTHTHTHTHTHILSVTHTHTHTHTHIHTHTHTL